MSALHGHIVAHRANIQVHANRRGWLVLEVDGHMVSFPLETGYELSNRLVEVAEAIEAGEHKYRSV